MFVFGFFLVWVLFEVVFFVLFGFFGCLVGSGLCFSLGFLGGECLGFFVFVVFLVVLFLFHIYT